MLNTLDKPLNGLEQSYYCGMLKIKFLTRFGSVRKRCLAASRVFTFIASSITDFTSIS